MAEPPSTVEPTRPQDFIREIVADDLKAGRHGRRVNTRFPPEPNGYLHIGHAKSICLNFGVAEEFGGLCNLRFDDTNPTKEDIEYVDSIQEDVRWLGFDWDDRMFYASDYFEQMYELRRAADPRRQGLRRQPDGRRDPRVSRHADRAGPQQPVPRPIGRGEPRSVPAHAGRRVSRRRARAAREDRHGVAEHQHAGPDAVPHPARDASPHAATPGASIRPTTTRTRSRTRSRASRTRSARWSSRIIGRCTTGSSTTSGTRRRSARGRSRSSSRG